MRSLPCRHLMLQGREPVPAGPELPVAPERLLLPEPVQELMVTLYSFPLILKLYCFILRCFMSVRRIYIDVGHFFLSGS